MNSPRDEQGATPGGGPHGPGGVRHAVDDVADYLAGRCDAGRAEEIRAHLRGCPTCAADFAWAAAFRATSGPQAVHLTPDRIAELSAAAATSAPHEQAHLVACADCARELSLLRSLAVPPEVSAAMRPEPAAASPAPSHRSTAGTAPSVSARVDRAPRRRATIQRPPLWRPTWRWAPALLAAAAVVVLLLRPWQPEDLAALRGFAQLQALPVELDRGAPPEAGFAEFRMRGLEAYQGGDYASATTLLTEADRLRPEDPEVLLYLGSCALLRGLAADAVTVLERASSAARHASGPAGGAPPALAAEIGWQLAQAHLVRGDRKAAEATLRELAAWSGPRGQAVDELLARVRGAGR